MKLVASYNFNGGEEFIISYHKDDLNDVLQVINSINADDFKTKQSNEKTKGGKLLYSPLGLNGDFKKRFNDKGWFSLRENCDYNIGSFKEGYIPSSVNNAYREMDFVKNKLGVEVQFGKYSFMVYNVCAKMTIFKNFGHINAGIEIVPVYNLAKEMSTGVSYFEQIAWDLSIRGVSDIDIPVLILGIDV